jgi:hypothetical protein
MYGGEIAAFDWIVRALGPPLLGSGCGLPFGLAGASPAARRIAGAAGGAAGAWAGVVLYCNIQDLEAPIRQSWVFTRCVLAGFLLGAIPLPFYLAGPP